MTSAHLIERPRTFAEHHVMEIANVEPAPEPFLYMAVRRRSGHSRACMKAGPGVRCSGRSQYSGIASANGAA
jgi:hypothetical protein